MNLSAGFTPMQWTDYSGGFTDDVYSDDTSICAKNDNFLVDRNKKLYNRPGSNLYYSAHPQPNGTNRIQRFMKFPDETNLLVQVGSKIYYDTGSAWTAITGNGGVDPFVGLGSTNNVSWAYWNQQFIMANDGGSVAPIRMWKDAGGNWNLITAGLPVVDNTQYSFPSSTGLSSGITLANSIRTQMLAHYADVTNHGSGSSGATHKTADTVSQGLVVSACSDLATLLSLTTSMLRAYQNHHNDSQAASVYHATETPQSSWPTANQAPVASVASRTLIDTSAPTTLVDAVARLNDIKKCYNTHQGRVDIHSGGANNENNVVTTPFIYGFVQGPLAQLDQSKIYNIINRIKAQYNAHIAAHATSTAYNHAAQDTTNVITDSDCGSPETAQSLLFHCQLKYAPHEQDASLTSAWVYHVLQETGPHVLTPPLLATYQVQPIPDIWGGIRAGNWSDMVIKINDIQKTFNSHFNDAFAHQPATAGELNAFQIPGGEPLALASYLYAFHWQYNFNVGTIQNQLVGPVLEVGAPGVISIDFEGLAVTNLPTLANGTGQNYDTGLITLECYRTTDGGNTFYHVMSLTNGNSTFTDFVTDSELIGRPLLYITGGVLDHDPPPIATCVHITGGTAYYGNIIDTGESFPYRVRQAVQNEPDACPGDFFDDLEDAVVGISSVKTVPVVGCVHSFYRLDGAFTEKGSGFITHQSLTNTIGLLSEPSLVRVDNGVFFAGTDGFYLTDGYNLTKLSDRWNKTYQAMTANGQGAKITGTYDNLKRRIWWSVRFASGTGENDSFVILDLNYDFSKPCWTTASNAGHFSPSTAIFYNHQLVRGHTSGYVFLHADSLLEDPYVDSTTTPANWGTKAILFDWKSTFVSWGNSSVRKWVPMCEWTSQNDTNIHVQALGHNDNDRNDHNLVKNYNHDHYLWGENILVWGFPLLLWNYHGNIDVKRYFPATALRCTYKQIEFTNALVNIVASTNKGTASVNGTTKVVTLDTGGQIWPLDCEGYFLTFASDGYGQRYEILKKNSTTSPTSLTVLDPGSVLGTLSSVEWQIIGQEKGQIFHLLDCALWGRTMSLSQTGARAGV